MATAQPQARLGRPGTPGLCFAILEIIWESEIGNRSRQKNKRARGSFYSVFCHSILQLGILYGLVCIWCFGLFVTRVVLACLFLLAADA